MRPDVLRFSRLMGIFLLVVGMLISSCTRPKSSGPPESTTAATAAVEETRPTGDQPTLTPLSGDAAMNATTTALAATATAGVQQSQETEASPTGTSEAAEAEPTDTPEPTQETQPTNTPKPTQTSAADTPETHTVKEGENLFRIALQYGMTYQELAAINGIANPNVIQAGRVLKLERDGTTTPSQPSTDERHHTVKAGENLFRVALQYNMLYTALAQANNLSYPYTIYPGQKLIIP